MLAAIFRKSTLLVHYNPQILLIIKTVMSVYENFIDFNLVIKTINERKSAYQIECE